ncbi:DUF3027 domain-containing protein [Subtercola sp. Z020]|nr:DUF3027 domain-containing protein [Subtercola sp. Z020]
MAEADGSIAEIVYEADPVLLAAVEQARSALAEITPADTIGELIGHEVEGEHVLSLFFASRLAGYPDWHWTATLSRVSDTDEPSVLEVELLPGEASVLSPAWVPWADRLSSDAIVDESESEFDDDDTDDDETDDDETGDADADDADDAAGEGYGDDSGIDDSDDDDSDDDDSDDDDSDDPDDEEVAALALRRDRDGIDIDTIAEEGFEGFESGHPEAEHPESDRPEPTDPETDPQPAVIDPDAGAAFDATDDFTHAGDPEDFEGLDPDAEGR